MVMTSAAVWMGNEKQAEAAASFKVHFIEAGTGDGALLQYGSGKSAKYALIDAGPQTTQLLGGKTIDVSRRVHNYLKKYKIRRLEFIIMTHPHKDTSGDLFLYWRTDPSLWERSMRLSSRFTIIIREMMILQYKNVPHRK